MEPTSGTLINPRIRLVDELGRGAMGSVWRAEHLTLDTHVAVKLIAHDRDHDVEEALERFRREAKAAASIKSHHIVQTFDYGVAESGDPYIVLELLDGESLEAQLARTSGISLADTARMVEHVARALASAHAAGIIHRDIKPANIFHTTVEGASFYKVLDFGVAKLEREALLSDVGDRAPENQRDADTKLTMAGTLVGTPEYMSPQLMLADPATRADDLWALAVVAYRCLTGVLPFRGDSFDDVSDALVAGQFDAPSAHTASLTSEVDAWFARALAPDATQRFRTVDEFVASFSSLGDQPGSDVLATNESVAGQPLTTLAVTTGSPRRALWVALATLGLVGVGGGFFLRHRAQRDSATNRPNLAAPFTKQSAVQSPQAAPGVEDRSTARRDLPAESSARNEVVGKTPAATRTPVDGSQSPPLASSVSSSASPPPELPERSLGF